MNIPEKKSIQDIQNFDLLSLSDKLTVISQKLEELDLNELYNKHEPVIKAGKTAEEKLQLLKVFRSEESNMHSLICELNNLRNELKLRSVTEILAESFIHTLSSLEKASPDFKSLETDQKIQTIYKAGYTINPDGKIQKLK
jgi:hypothetical protein